MPKIYAMEDTCITVPDDILINMALEVSRGDQRHGSCGMGINECDQRTVSGYGLTIGAVKKMDAGQLYKKLFDLRKSYVCRTYVTRHGAGKFNCECSKDEIGNISHDLKNVKRSLFLTHLNESGNCVVMKEHRIPVNDFINLPEIYTMFDKFYLSDTHFGEDVRSIEKGKEVF